MNTEQDKTPLYDALVENKRKQPISFHVPGHKYGEVFSAHGFEDFQSVLQMDATEISGLDDLHAPEDVIDDAQRLTSRFFSSDESFFLVNGTTSGNLAMILTVCGPGDVIIVQRNCHKSVLNGLELAGARPVFISPEYEFETRRFSKMTISRVGLALQEYPQAKAVFLTYPDYFGRTYPLEDIIREVHQRDIPILIDEAHGFHFQLGEPFPPSALKMGADAVVQSAHKMGTAMTMASVLHINNERINRVKLKHYLQMFQSSSPSYPLMASLDLARHYLAHMTKTRIESLVDFIEETRQVFQEFSIYWRLSPLTEYDDLLKITLIVCGGQTGFDVAKALESAGIHVELATSDQVLLTLGLSLNLDLEDLKIRLATTNFQLKKAGNHATIKIDQISFPDLQTLDMSYSEMQKVSSKFKVWTDAIGLVSAQSVIPYPPGIPLIMKGERISTSHVEKVRLLQEQGARFQNTDIEQGIRAFKGESM